MSPHGHKENHKDEKSQQASGAAAPAQPDVQAGASASTENEPGSLAAQIQRLEAEKQELMNTLVRRQADFENYRKRVEKERHQDRHRGTELLVEQLLPVLDAFDHALAAGDDPGGTEFRKGFELIRRQLWDALAKQGLSRIESVGKEFNPHYHHAIERVETADYADGAVISEFQPGYVYHGRVLRPAMVRVAGAPASKAAGAARQEN